MVTITLHFLVTDPLSVFNRRSRWMKKESKAKAVASTWGAEFIQNAKKLARQILPPK